MTVQELVDKLNELQIPGTHEVRVSAFGGMRQGKPIKDISVGFDWDMNSVILHPELTLWVKPKENKQ